MLVHQVMTRDPVAEVSIRDVMIHDPMTVDPHAHVSTAAHLMVNRKVGCLPVLDDQKLVGSSPR
jgi:CBS domain-containing protein